MKIIDIPQGSDQWHEERHKCVTGTRFESAVGATWDAKKECWRLAETAAGKAKQQTLLCELVAEMQSELEIDDYQNEAMVRGHELEPLSIAAASKKHNVKLEECGMLQSDIHHNFKYSPDAVCFSNGVIIGGYETKAKQGKRHIEYILANEVPREHFWQCLCPMVMDDCVQWWMFGHYDDLNTVNPLFTTGIKRADHIELIERARVVLAEFLAEVERVNKQILEANNG